MSSIYYVTIEPVGKEDCFRVTWHDEGNNRINSFEQAPEITIEDTLRLSRMAKFQLGIGQKLFRFLDGETHTFRRALDRAHRKAEILQLHLSTCKQTHDWPFELLADTGTFLLPHRVHLVRNVSTRSEGKTIIPRDRPLKLLFMACSALDVKPELDFEQEEEAIFEITGNLPIDMDVEDSGTLEGLRSQLEQEQYDVVHLSGFTGIAKNGRPYFIMEDETGYQHKVLPYRLWNEALIENPPRLLFLSGSRTGKAKDRHSTTGTVSFARMMKKNYNIPAVLEWGKSVRDAQAIHAGKMIFHDLSRGKSILQAVQRARFDMLKKFPHTPEPAWPLLRLFSSGMPLNAIVKENQRKQPKIQVIKHVYLKNSRVKVLADGFVGRRRQLQTSLRALKQDVDKVGVMLLGTGGLGKSCLAGKICDRFNDYTLIIVHGRLNTITLEPALEDAFIKAQDEKGQQILSQEEKMIDKLSELCATSFKEKNYLFLLDDFEQNLEGVDKGHPGSLLPEAADLLNVLLHHLPSCNKKTQLIITSRYTFPLAPQYGVSIGSLCQGVWLTGFRGAEQRKKARALENITNYPDQSLVPRLLAAGHGNPRLMEWIDLLVGEMKKAEVMPLLEAVKNRQEEFIRQHVIRELLQREEKEFELFLCRFSIYRRPVQMEGVKQVTGKTWLFKWKKLLGRGMDLSLIEHDQARHSYQVTPLLREELSENTKDIESCHKAAFNYYKEIYRTKGTVTSMLPHLDYVFKANLSRISKKLSTPYPDFKLEQDIYDSFDPILTEELIFHALGCGKEEIASKEGWRLINQLRDKLALQESQRVGKLILAEKKLPCSNADDALLLNNLAATMHELRDYRQSISYLEQSLTIGRAIYGGEMHYDIARNFINLGGAWRALGEYKKAIDYYRQALPIFKNVFDDKHPTVAITLHHLGAALHDSGNYREAVGYHEQALKITRDALGENQTLVMEGLSRLGDCWVELGELEKALDYFEQAKSIALVLYGERHPHLAFVFNSIGLAWSKLGEFNKAIEYYEQAILILQEVYGENHPDVAAILNNYGESLVAVGKTDRGKSYLEKGLKIQEGYGENETPKKANTLNNLGMVLYTSGEFKKAIYYFEQALITLRKFFPNHHPGEVTALANLGESYRALEGPEKAIGYFEQALEVLKKLHEEESADTANTLNNLGLAWHELEDYSQAIDYYKQAHAIFQAVYGDEHPDAATVLNNLGHACGNLNEIKEAITYFEQALEVLKKLHEEENPDIANTLNNLGLAWYELEDYPRAIDYYKQAHAIFQAVYGDEHPDVATVLNNLARAWDASDEFEKAKDYYEQTLSILKRLGEESLPQRVNVLNDLGLVMWGLEDHNQAINYFERALAIERDIHEEDSSEVTEILNDLGQLYLKIGEKEKAKNYLEKVYKHRHQVLGSGHPDTKHAYESLRACKETH